MYTVRARARATMPIFALALAASAATVARADSVTIDDLFSISSDARARVASGSAGEVVVSSAALERVAREPGEAVVRNVPLADGTVETFALTSFSVFTADAQIVEGGSGRQLPRPNVVLFQGASVTDVSPKNLIRPQH